LVSRTLQTFDSISTSKIKIYVTNVVGDNHTQLVELEAWTPAAGAAETNWLVTDQLGTPRMIVDKSGSLNNLKRHEIRSRWRKWIEFCAGALSIES
jgi:hypothetical protein